MQRGGHLSYHDRLLCWRAASLRERAEWLRTSLPEPDGCLSDPDPDHTAALKDAFLQSLQVGTFNFMSDRLQSDGIEQEELALLLRAHPPVTAHPPHPTARWLSYARTAEAETAVRPYPLLHEFPWCLLAYFWPLISREVHKIENALSRYARYHKVLLQYSDAFPFEWIKLYLEALFPFVGRTLLQEAYIATYGTSTNTQYRARGTPGQLDESAVLSAGRALTMYYPAVYRSMVTVTRQQTRFVLSFVERLHADWTRILTEFALPPNVVIDRVVCSGSDRHGCGQVVLFVELQLPDNSRRAIVYKPRSLQPEKLFYSIADRLEQRWIAVEPFKPALLCRQSYGWMDFVPYEPATHESDLATYYHRLGGLTALFHVFSINDMHAENLISHNTHPVCVDLETLLHPTEEAFPTGGFHRSEAVVKANSILGIGLLPEYLSASSAEKPVLVSGIAESEGNVTLLKMVEEFADTYAFDYRSISVTKSNNTPHSDTITSFSDFDADFIEGFEDAYSSLLANMCNLCDLLPPLFKEHDVRVLLRSTRFYELLLEGLTHPARGSDELLREIWLNQLYQAVPSFPALRGVIASEAEAIRRGDIPKFTVRAPSTRIQESNGNHALLHLTRSPLATWKSRMHKLSSSDMRRQVTIFQQSVSAWRITKQKPVSKKMGAGELASGYLKLKMEPVQTGTTEQVSLTVARTIGEALIENSLRCGSCSSWANVSSSDEQNWSCAAVDPFLYDGLSGIIFFLTYLAKATGEERFHRAAREGFCTLRANLRARQAVNDPVGAFIGLAGYLLLLCHLEHSWGESLLDPEHNIYTEKIRNKIEEETDVDVVSGLSGAAVCLLRCGIYWDDKRLISLAARCADRVVFLLREADFSSATTSESGGELLGGFAHGCAGISWALRTIAAAKSDQRYVDIAEELVRYERTLFLPHIGNWRDVRQKGAFNVGSDLVAWCHGAAGIALSRIDVEQRVGGIERQEINIAAGTMLRRMGSIGHSLCHGSLGNLMILQEAEKYDLLDVNVQMSIKRVEKDVLTSLQNGHVRTGLPNDALSWGLMTGLAGIGYGVLRIWNRDLPNVLCLEGPRIDSRVPVKR